METMQSTTTLIRGREDGQITWFFNALMTTKASMAETAGAWLAAGVVGALLVSWVTFAPSFLWIFVGAPYVEYLHGRPSLAAALSGITPAVVGVIVNLAAWFALQTFFATTGELRIGPLRLHTVEMATIDLFAIALAAGAFVALVRLRLPLLAVLGACAALGAVGYALGLST